MNKKFMKTGQASLATLLTLSSTLTFVASAPIQANADTSDTNEKVNAKTKADTKANPNIQTKVIKFPYSSQQHQSQSVTIPGMRHVKDIRTNNGQMFHSQYGNTLGINVYDGKGETVQTGGSLEPEKTKFVTGQSSPNYTDAEGYSGTLTKYVVSGEYTPPDTRYETVIAKTNTPTWYKQDFEPTMFWQKDGYSGTVTLKNTSHTVVPQSVLLDINYTQYATLPDSIKFKDIDEQEALVDIKKQFGPSNPEGLYFVNPTIYSSHWLSSFVESGSWYLDGVMYYYKKEALIKILVDGFLTTGTFEGNITKPASDTRVYAYQGDVVKPAEDTRTWDTQYAYDVTVEYTDVPEPPTITSTPAGVDWSNENITVAINDNEHTSFNDFKIEYKLEGESDWKTYTSPLTITKEGSTTIYSRVVVNDGGVSEVAQKTVNLDKTPPDVSAQVSTTDWSNDVVNITINTFDAGSGIKRIQLPDGNWVNSDTVTFNAKENKSYTFVVEDNAGNRTTKVVDVANLDYDLPTVDLSLDKTHWTNEDVLILIHTDDSQSGVKRVQLPNGNWISTKDSSYRVTENGLYEFVVEDNAGNINRQSITVSNIDREIPTAPVITISNEDWGKGYNSFTLNGSTDNQSGIKKYQYQLDNGEWVDYTGVVNISTEGTTTIRARAWDNADNVSEISTKSVKVDNTVPNVNISSNPDDWTKENVLLTATATDDLSGVAKIQIPNGTWINDNRASQTVTENGDYAFVVQDKAGNETTEIFTVDNIDRVAPTLSLNQMVNDLTNQDVVIKASASDGQSGIKRIKLPSGEWVNGSNADYRAPANGTYTFVSEDNVGNQTTKSITISNIDKTSPTAPKITNNQEWNRNPSIPVTITGGSDGQSGLKGIEYKLEGATNTGWTNYTGVFEVTSEGLTKIIARTVDNVGNVSDEVTSYVRIDRSAPHNSSIIIHLKNK